MQGTACASTQASTICRSQTASARIRRSRTPFFATKQQTDAKGTTGRGAGQQGHGLIQQAQELDALAQARVFFPHADAGRPRHDPRSGLKV